MKNWLTPRKRTATLHPKIKLLLGFQYQKELELLRQWIDDFTSPDGELKSIDEFQATFHSVFLELYINQLLRFSGAKVETNQVRPDFKLRNAILHTSSKRLLPIYPGAEHLKVSVPKETSTVKMISTRFLMKRFPAFGGA